MRITKHVRKLWLLVAALVLAFGFAQPASAQLAAVGPVDPATGFPAWFEDANGLRVQLCDEFDPLLPPDEQLPCLPELINPALGVVAGNIGEALYYAAVAEFAAPSGEDFAIECVLEAAGPEVEGDPNVVANVALINFQFIEGQNEGDYTVVAPCATFTFNHPADTVGDNFRFRAEVAVEGLAPDFAGALGGPDAPVQIFASNGTGAPGFLGDALTLSPLLSPLQPDGVMDVTISGPINQTSNLFTVVGKISGCTDENEAPIAVTDLETTKAGTAIDINVLANDSDLVIEFDELGNPVPRVITPPLGTVLIEEGSITPIGAGTAVVNTDNTVTFTPAAGFAGEASFQYTVTDPCGAISEPASVIVLVEDLLANEAEYRVKTGKWNLSGTSNFRDIIVTDGLETAYATGLFGAQEVPPVTSAASGEFFVIFTDGVIDAFDYDLNIEVPLGTQITQAHIHVGNAGTNGPVIFFLCTNLGNAPEGTVVQLCENTEGVISVSGTLTANELLPRPDQGINTFAEAVTAIQAGGTYANAHSVVNPPGEVRGQIGRNVISLRAGENGPALGAAEVQAGAGSNLPWSFSGKSIGSPGSAPHLIHAESGLAISDTIELRLR